jgi:formate-dependent nitrite reductase membrane component NrfD
MSTHAAPRLPIVREAFLVGYAPQGEWSWLIAAALFFGKVGAGLFVLSYFTDFELGAAVGLGLAGAGKPAAHLLFLGRPERFLRALARWRSSRLSQGLVTLGTFVAAGLVYLTPAMDLWDENGLTQAAGVVAAATGIVLMFWEGIVLMASRGVPLWDSWLLPLLALLYSLLGGTTMVLVLRAFTDSAGSQTELEGLQLGLLVLNLALVGVYVASARVRSAAAQFAASLLTRGPLGAVFLAGAVGVGLVGTLVLASVSVATGSEAALAAAAATDLLGHFLVFFAILRAGVHPPLRRASTWGEDDAAWTA